METVIFAFDIEARGKSPSKHGIVSCGIIVGNLKGNVIYKMRLNISELPGQTFESRCMEEFWNKQPELLTELSKDQITPEQFAKKFREILDLCDCNYNVYLLCDNPAFDAKFIDYYLDLAGCDSMQYKADGKTYQSVHDSDSYARGYMKYKFDKPWMSDRDLGVEIPDLPTHYPENDAERIYNVHLNLVNKN